MYGTLDTERLIRHIESQIAENNQVAGITSSFKRDAGQRNEAYNEVLLFIESGKCDC